MKRTTAVLILFCVLSCGLLGTSCRKSAFPRDPYRGSSMNKNSHPQKPAKAKSERIYRSIRK